MQDGNQPVKFAHPLEELLLNNKIGKVAKSFGGPSYYSGTYALSFDSKNNNKNTTFFKDVMDALLKKPRDTLTLCDIWHPYYPYPNYCVWKPINSNKDIDITVDFYNGNPRFVL